MEDRNCERSEAELSKFFLLSNSNWNNSRLHSEVNPKPQPPALLSNPSPSWGPLLQSKLKQSAVSPQPDPSSLSKETLKDFLFSIFSDEPLTNLQPVQEDLLRFIIRKKQGSVSQQNKTVSVEGVRLDQLKHRPKEEGLKFVFSRGFKTLFKNFKAENKQPFDVESKFYRYYFEHLCNESRDLTAFINPNKNKRGHYGLSYLKRVFESSQFRRDFMKFLNDDLLRRYAEEIKEKIDSLVKKAIRIGKNSIDLSLLKMYLMSPNAKIPWTLREVAQAKEDFVRDLGLEE